MGNARDSCLLLSPSWQELLQQRGFLLPGRTNFLASFKGQPRRLLEGAVAHLSLRSAAATAPGAPVAAAEFSLVPRAGGDRVSAATRRRHRAAEAAGPRNSERAPVRGCPARRAPGGGSGQRLGLGLGCRGGGHRSGGSRASRPRVR